jgi:hypothetical protein
VFSAAVHLSFPNCTSKEICDAAAAWLRSAPFRKGGGGAQSQRHKLIKNKDNVGCRGNPSKRRRQNDDRSSERSRDRRSDDDETSDDERSRGYERSRGDERSSYSYGYSSEDDMES